MSIWLEIHCDAETDDDNYQDYHNWCASNRNNDHGMRCFNTQTSVLKCLKILEGNALGEGWKKIKEKWYCPYHVKKRNL